VGGIAGDDGEHRVAVGRRLGGEVRAENAVRAGSVVDHDRLAERPRHLLRDHPRDDIGDPASRVGNDPAQRLRRVALRLSRRGEDREREQPDSHRPDSHRRDSHTYPGPSIGGCFLRNSSLTSSPRPGRLSGHTMPCASTLYGEDTSSSRNLLSFEISPSKYPPLSIAERKWIDAAWFSPVIELCGWTGSFHAEASAAMRSASVRPPVFDRSGC